MPDCVVATIQRRDGEELRATLNEYKGSLYAHLRVYFRSDVDGEWHPTRAGITVRADRFDELEAAIAALRKAIDAEPKKRPDRYERYARQRSA
jgi:hypothetical protein